MVTAEKTKCDKYSDLKLEDVKSLFYPFALTSLGGWGPQVSTFIDHVASEVGPVAMDELSLREQMAREVAIQIQRGNWGAVRHGLGKEAYARDPGSLSHKQLCSSTLSPTR